MGISAESSTKSPKKSTEDLAVFHYILFRSIEILYFWVKIVNKSSYVKNNCKRS